ncbi:muscarinic acetylcholine receptor DM1-like [Artemia franciscana]|uniref:muscarinic acetylcholine receptor DM1-like n=1 Tax=Artemia franciscana TaxID=6661 RepID=UPI0032DA55DE
MPSGEDTPIDIEELKRNRSRSKTNVDPVDYVMETTYVPPSAYAKEAQNLTGRGKLRNGVQRIRAYLSSIGQFFQRTFDSDSDCPGSLTPGSVETPFPSSVSRCTSLNLPRSHDTPTQSDGKRNWDKNQLFRISVEDSNFKEPQNGSLSRSQSNESVFTIVIKFPDEESNRPSIKMLPDISRRSQSQPSLAASSTKGNITSHLSLDRNTLASDKKSGLFPTFSTNSWNSKPKPPLRQTISSISGNIPIKPMSLPICPPTSVYFSPWVPRSCMPVAPSPLMMPKNSRNKPLVPILKQSSDSPSENSLPINVKIVPKQMALQNCSNKTSLNNIRRATPIIVQNHQKKNKKNKKKNQEKKQDRKAAKTLSAILLAFIITWTPYNILVLIRSFFHCENTKCFSNEIWDFSYYLCYINSTINPVCYALCNASFRRTYVRILSCKWHLRIKTAVQRGIYN